MRYLSLFLVLLLISCGHNTKESKVSKEEITTYYFIRHAEKDRTVIDDPELTEKGKERAKHWSKFFDTIDLEAVYSTPYMRTKQTAQPTAGDKGLPIQSYSADNLYDEAFKMETKGLNVLVVGHSNTTPAFVNTILGETKYPQISDTENGMLYKVVVPEKGETTVRLTKVDF